MPSKKELKARIAELEGNRNYDNQSIEELRTLVDKYQNAIREINKIIAQKKREEKGSVQNLRKLAIVQNSCANCKHLEVDFDWYDIQPDHDTSILWCNFEGGIKRELYDGNEHEAMEYATEMICELWTE
jgi:uncharacterized coiled-coil protein SlyX